MTIQPEFPDFQVQEDSGDGLKSLIPNCNLTCRPQSCSKQRCCSDPKISNDDLWMKTKKIMILLYITKENLFMKKSPKVGNTQCGKLRNFDFEYFSKKYDHDNIFFVDMYVCNFFFTNASYVKLETVWTFSEIKLNIYFVMHIQMLLLFLCMKFVASYKEAF